LGQDWKLAQYFNKNAKGKHGSMFSFFLCFLHFSAQSKHFRHFPHPFCDKGYSKKLADA
jgi:hypothetical protein